MSETIPRALILVVDAQVGFVNGSNQETVARIGALLENPAELGVAFTQYRNLPGSSYDRFLDWRLLSTDGECEIVPLLRPKAVRIFRKSGYSALTDELRILLESEQIETVYLCGFDTDCCVLTSAAQLFELGIRPVILEHYCASNGGPESHAAALHVLQRLIGARHILPGKQNCKELAQRRW